MTWTETYDSKKMKLDGGEVLRHKQGGEKVRLICSMVQVVKLLCYWPVRQAVCLSART